MGASRQAPQRLTGCSVQSRPCPRPSTPGSRQGTFGCSSFSCVTHLLVRGGSILLFGNASGR